jgi:prepilin-type N-terminal cleavage/methylation domain-containing protein
MKPQKHHAHRQLPGFTLVELLVVILIIVVLAALSILGITMVRKSAAAAKDAGTLRQISTCINMYAADHNDLMPGPLFSRQTAVYNSEIPSNPKEWRRLSDCLASYMGFDKPEKGEFIHPMAASWQTATSKTNVPAWFVQQQLPLGSGASFGNPWGKPAPASNDERTPMKLSVVLAQPKAARTWAMTELDQLHPGISDPGLKEGCPEGLAHGSYRLGIYFDGSVGKFDKNNNPL